MRFLAAVLGALVLVASFLALAWAVGEWLDCGNDIRHDASMNVIVGVGALLTGACAVFSILWATS